jgi:guanosine-3',5'-bis(diphosphate) 3'-pyrophosphohydrolase
MPEGTPVSLGEQYRPLLEAVGFAARAHRHQLRKDGQTPYVAHVVRVCLIARHIFGIDDPEVLQAALLHDTIEDTATDYDDIADRFGNTTATTVATLTKDMRLPDDAREEAYCQGLETATDAVKICKLADIFDNLIDSKHLSPEGRQRTVARSRRYMQSLGENRSPMVDRAYRMVSQLIEENR